MRGGDRKSPGDIFGNLMSGLGGLGLPFSMGQKSKRSKLSEALSMFSKATFEDIRKLIEIDKEDPNKREGMDNLGNTPMNFYFSMGEPKLEIIKYLVEKGKADIRVKSLMGQSWLDSYSFNRDLNLEIVKYLVELKADITSKPAEVIDQYTRSQSKNSIEVVKYLINSKIDISSVDSNNAGILHSVCLNNPNLEFIKFLVEKKANPNLITHEGRHNLLTCYGVCQASGMFFFNNKEDKYKILKYLVEDLKQDINFVGPRGSTLTNNMQDNPDVRFTKYLLEHGADPFSEHNGESAIVRFLSEHLDDKGFTDAYRPYLSQICAEKTCFKKSDEGYKKCSRCKTFYYCSTTCQKKDWPNHKKYCFEPNN